VDRNPFDLLSNPHEKFPVSQQVALPCLAMLVCSLFGDFNYFAAAAQVNGADSTDAAPFQGTRLRRVPSHSCSLPPFCRSPKQGAEPQRGDYATASAQPADPVPPARAPQASAEERSGRQLCQMHNCEKLLNGKVAARGRAVEPDKAGATNEKL
jgi:hypothetical protein